MNFAPDTFIKKKSPSSVGGYAGVAHEANNRSQGHAVTDDVNSELPEIRNRGTKSVNYRLMLRPP